jgi:hypothetical protein
MKEKRVYQTNADGYLLGTILLSEQKGDYKEGAWLIPARCAEVEPPKSKEGHLIKWSGKKWEYEAIPEPEPELEHEPTKQEKLNELNLWLESENVRIASDLTLDLASGLTLKEAQTYSQGETELVIAEYEKRLAEIQEVQ